MTWRTILREFLRGFTDADLESLARKLDSHDNKPGGMIAVTNAELAAVGELMRRRECFALSPEER